MDGEKGGVFEKASNENDMFAGLTNNPRNAKLWLYGLQVVAL